MMHRKQQYKLGGMLFGLLFAVAPLWAQEPATPGTTVVAKPKGTVVYLQGEYGLAGRAPFVIMQPLDGTYRLEAKRKGFETYSAIHEFRSGASQRIAIELTEKTRGRALVRSMFIPGWGQRYSEQKFKGWTITVLAAGSLAYLTSTEIRYQNAVDGFDHAVQVFRDNQNNAELRDVLLANVNDAQSRLDSRFNDRRRALIISSSIYIYNILDALLFFPKFSESGVRLTLDADPMKEMYALGLRLKM